MSKLIVKLRIKQQEWKFKFHFRWEYGISVSILEEKYSLPQAKIQSKLSFLYFDWL